MDIYAGLT